VIGFRRYEQVGILAVTWSIAWPRIIRALCAAHRLQAIAWLYRSTCHNHSLALDQMSGDQMSGVWG
jgi:hypothetical protein